MKLRKMCDVLLSAIIAGVLYTACGVPTVEAQWQTPFGTIPVGKGPGATGFNTVGGSGGTGAKCLIDTVPPTYGPCPGTPDWYIVGSAAYPTAQSAIDAAGAANGGVVYFPCQTINIGSGAIGLDLRGKNFVRLVGGWSVGSGAAVCGGGGIVYSGTGTMIDITGTQGVEIEGLALIGLSSSVMIKADGVTQSAFAKISRNTIFGKTTATGICISFANIITSSVEDNSIHCYVGMRGINGAVGDVSNAINISGNMFQPGNTFHLQNAVTWNVWGNTFEGNVSGNAYSQSAGVSGCFLLKWWGNTVDDPVAVGPSLGLIETNCRTVDSKGNNYAMSAGQSAIVLTAASNSKVSSSGDYFQGNSTAININTGNCGQIDNYLLSVSMVGTITGTAGCTQNPVAVMLGGAIVGNQLFVGFGAQGQIILQGGGSGTVTVVPAGGALGAAVATMQAGTYDVVGHNLAQTLTNKTMSGASNTFSNIALSSLASQAANTIVANVTGGAASPTAYGVTSTILTWLATSSSANLRAAMTDETGSGALFFANGDFGAATGTSLSITNNQNGATRINITNSNVGTGAEASYQATNGTSTIQFGMRGVNETNYGLLLANQAYIYGGGNFNIMADSGGAIVMGGASQALRVNGGNGVNVGASTTDPGAGNLRMDGFISTKAPVTFTGTSGTIGAQDSSAIFNASGAFTVTLPTCNAANGGRWLDVKSIVAQTINSASSNVVPRAGGAAGTALLASGAGNWARLQCDATNWIIMAGS